MNLRLDLKNEMKDMTWISDNME